MKKPKPKTRRRGSISKHGTDGRYLARVRLGTVDADGKRVGNSKVCRSKSEAEAWLAQELARIDRGEPLSNAEPVEPVSRITAYTLESWCRKYYGSTLSISPRTVQDDLALFQRYVFQTRDGTSKPTALSQTPLLALTFPVIRDHVNALAKSGLAAATVSRVYRIIRARLNDAVVDQEDTGLTENPLAGAKWKATGAPPKKRKVLSELETQALLAVLPQTTEGVFIATCVWLGCRPSEAAGAQWGDFDIDAAGTWLIQRALVRTKPTADQRGLGESWTLEKTKTGVERPVSLPADLIARLRAHRAQQAQDKLNAGREYENNKLVFASPFGKPLHLDLIVPRFLRPWLLEAAVFLNGETLLPLPPVSRSKAYRDAVEARLAQQKEAVKATGYPVNEISLYRLRHSFVTRLIRRGVPITDVRDAVRHKSINTTLGYVMPNEEAANIARQTLEEAFTPQPLLKRA